MEWLPAESAAVVKVALPPDNEPVPSVAAPSMKVTVPVGEKPPDTVAVKLTLWPELGAVEDGDRLVVVDAFPTVTVAV